VTFNRIKDLKDCLNSLLSAKTRPFEIIVVDSNSTDGTSALVEKFPVKLITILERSMVKARNIGLNYAIGEIVAYIDDDVIVSPDWAEHIIELYLRQDIGGVGGRVLPINQCQNPVSISDKYLAVGRIFDNGFVSNNYEIYKDHPIEVDTLIGCNMSFRRKLLLKAGAFDENYKGTCFREDTDASMRVRLCGYKLIYNPNALLWHKYKGKTVNDKWFYWYTYNHFYFCFKNFKSIKIQKFFMLVQGAFFPPVSYVRKSGIRLNMDPLAGLSIISGLLAAYKTYKMNRPKEGRRN
jgi:GT2 family glycosyltransferase